MAVDLIGSLALGGFAGWFGDWVVCALLPATGTRRSRALGALVCALAWAYVAWRWPPPHRYAWFLWAWALVVLADADLRQRVLPDIITLPLAVAGLLFRAVTGHASDAVYGLAAGAGLLAAIALLAYAIYRQEVFGWGDVKLGAALGAWLGWPEVLSGIVIGFVAGGAVGAALMLARIRAGSWRWRRAYLPLGPFLIAGSVAASVRIALL